MSLYSVRDQLLHLQGFSVVQKTFTQFSHLTTKERDLHTLHMLLNWTTKNSSKDSIGSSDCYAICLLEI